MGGVARGRAEKCADAIRGRSHFLDDFLQLLDHPARFDNCLFPIREFRPQIEQFAADRIAWRERRDHTIELFKKRKITRAFAEVFESFLALLAHRSSQSMP